MDPDKLEALLEAVREGRTPVADAMAALRDLPYEDLGFARVDHQRPLRTGAPEVVFGMGKTGQQIAHIMQRLASHYGRSLATKVSPEAAKELPEARFYEECGVLVLGELPEPVSERRVAILSAGTADLPIAREAEMTARYLACDVQTHFDVGVAGLHRTLEARKRLDGVRALVVVAGMDGALPSVMGGLVSCPVIAVPTSVGYGASFEGLAALLTMLNCCAPGVAVVNIDNGFGAAYLAFQIASAGCAG